MSNMDWETGANIFVDAAASESAPGGGAVAAVIAAAGCGLCMMAVSVTANNKKTPPEDKELLNKTLAELSIIKNKLKAAAPGDCRVYEKVVSARRLPKENEARAELLQQALKESALLPLETAETALEAIRKADAVKEKIWPVIVSDIICGRKFLCGAISCLLDNTGANMPYIKDEDFNNKLLEKINFLSEVCK